MDAQPLCVKRDIATSQLYEAIAQHGGMKDFTMYVDKSAEFGGASFSVAKDCYTKKVDALESVIRVAVNGSTTTTVSALPVVRAANNETILQVYTFGAIYTVVAPTPIYADIPSTIACNASSAVQIGLITGEKQSFETCFCMSESTTSTEFYKAVEMYLGRQNVTSQKGFHMYVDYGNQWNSLGWDTAASAFKNDQYALANSFYVGGSGKFLFPTTKVVSFPSVTVTKSIPRIQLVAVASESLPAKVESLVTPVSKQVPVVASAGNCSCTQKGAVFIELRGADHAFSMSSKKPLCVFSGTTFAQLHNIIANRVRMGAGMRLFADAELQFGYKNLVSAHSFLQSGFLGKDNVITVDLNAQHFASKPITSLPLVRYGNSQFAAQFYVLDSAASVAPKDIRGVRPDRKNGGALCHETDSGKCLIIFLRLLILQTLTFII